jgi:UDP-glucose 4-epimerase
MKILVTGATGFIGSALIKYLTNTQDFSVVGLVRSKKDITSYNACEFRLGELGSSNIRNINLSDVDLIIHTAGRAHLMNDTSTDPIEEFRRVNTYGTLDLAKLAVEAGVKRFIFLSSIKVNGESTELEIPFSINSIEAPCDDYGLSKYEAEIGLRKISCKTGLEVTIIRPPLVYGPGAKGNFGALIKILSAHVPLPLALVKNNRRSMVGLDNLLDMINVCVRHPKAANQTFLISDKNDLSTYSLLKLLGASIGKHAILFRFPVSILKLIAKLLCMEAKVQRITGTLQVDISHTCAELNWEPPFTIEQGLEKLNEDIK